MIHIVGAGPGAVDLITVRGQKLLSEADVVIYAGSLVSRALLDWARQDARIYDSASMDLEQVMEVMNRRNGTVLPRCASTPGIPASMAPYGNRWTVWMPEGYNMTYVPESALSAEPPQPLGWNIPCPVSARVW